MHKFMVTMACLSALVVSVPKRASGQLVEPDDLSDILNADEIEAIEEGMVHLKGLTELQFLILNNTSVGDDGLKELQDLTNLEILFLNETSITDLGLQYAAKFSKLSHVDVSGTAVTNDLQHL